MIGVFYSISNSPFLQRLFWSNAGFGSIRSLSPLKDIEPRYDSTVILSRVDRVPSSEDNKENFNPLTPSPYQAFLREEDFASKAPPKRTFASVLEYHDAYAAGRTTPSEVVEGLLPLIMRAGADRKGGGKHAVAFLATKAEIVRNAAEESTQRWKEGRQRGVLDGVVMVRIAIRAFISFRSDSSDEFHHRRSKTKKI